MFRVSYVMTAVFLAISGPSLAEPIDSKAAKKLLFSPKGNEIRILPEAGLSEVEAKTLKLVLGKVAYYGVAVIAPDAGLQAETTQAVAQHHSLEAAKVVALKQCNAARKGGKKCIVAAEVVPRKYKPRDFQLSQAATDTLRREYRRLRGAKGFAVSPSSGGWAFLATNAGVAEAAEARCNTSAGVKDCVTVVLD